MSIDSCKYTLRNVWKLNDYYVDINHSFKEYLQAVLKLIGTGVIIDSSMSPMLSMFDEQLALSAAG